MVVVCMAVSYWSARQWNVMVQASQAMFVRRSTQLIANLRPPCRAGRGAKHSPPGSEVDHCDEHDEITCEIMTIDCNNEETSLHL